MEQILGIALAVVSGVGIVGVIALALALRSASKEHIADLKAGNDLLDKERDEYERCADERDQALERAAKAEAERDTLRAELAATQTANAAQAEKEAQHVADEVRTAPDASDAVDRVLSEAARVPDDPAPAGAGDGGPGGPAV